MSLPIVLYALFGIYFVFLAMVLYVFVIADPNQSPLAAYWTDTMPKQVLAACSRCLGQRSLSVVEFVADRFLIIVYVSVVFGAWSIIFFFVYPWIERQSYVSEYHTWIGYVVFAACVASWRLASTSSPGIITARNLERYNHFPYDNFMFDEGQVCKTRKIPKLARSKFDRSKYQQNVARYDHFCGWVYNTIGEENYRFFLLFLLVHVTMCVYGTVAVGWLFYGEILDQRLLEATFIDRGTGEEIPSNWWIISQYLFNKYLWESAVFLLMAVMAVALGAFLGYHMYLTSVGMTTNESYKWGAIRKWYNHELRRYKEAVRKGAIVPESTRQRTQPSVSDDKDVTCTPGNAEETVSKREDDEDEIIDPGPMPRNIYDRGIIENWKEVLFPISLRGDRSISWDGGITKDKTS